MKITENKIFNPVIIILIFYIPLLIFFNWDVIKSLISGTEHNGFVFINRNMLVVFIPLVIVFYRMSLKKNKDTNQK